jgi:hypothetical protein
VLRAWRREEKGCGETFSPVATGTLYSRCGGAEEGGGPALAVLRGGEGWGLGVGTTRVTVYVALLLDPETGEGVGVDMWDPDTVTGDDCLF